MEHRWGARVPLLMRVRICGHGRLATEGRTVNVSASGAWVRTRTPVPLWSQVQVELEGPLLGQSEPRSIAACVVRTAPDGIALEWSDFAPEAIRVMLERMRRDVPPCGSDPERMPALPQVSTC